MGVCVPGSSTCAYGRGGEKAIAGECERVEKARKETLLQRTRSDSLAFFTFGESGRESKVTQEHAQHHASAHTAPSLLHTRAFLLCVGARVAGHVRKRDERASRPPHPCTALFAACGTRPATPFKQTAACPPWGQAETLEPCIQGPARAPPENDTAPLQNTHTHAPFVFS